MKNQFFYKRLVEAPVQVEGQEKKFNEFTDSFNPDFVIRTVEDDKKGLVVLLNDIHTRKQQVPIFNKQGKHTGFKNQDDTFQSEIHLLEEDAKRFRKLTEL